MRNLIACALAFCLTVTGAAAAEDQPPLIVPVAEQTLEDFQWQKRLVLVFANSPNDPSYIEQIELINEDADDLRARDVVVLVDTDPAAQSPLRLRLRPRGFMMAIVNKEGRINLRKPFPWNVREISRTIDKMPLRQQEIRAAKETE